MSKQKSLFVAAAVAEDKARQSVSYPEPAPDHVWFSQAFRDVGAARRRQIEVKGYDYAHDDAHAKREIVLSNDDWGAMNRLHHAFFHDDDDVTYRERIVDVAAMLVAEIERLDRKKAGIGDSP